MKYRRKTQAERQAWWRNLSAEEKSAYIEKKEQERQKHNTGKTKSSFIPPPPLTPEEMQEINNTMRSLGLERFIVLPDMPDPIPAEVRHILDED